jgi:hypothetical protein
MSSNESNVLIHERTSDSSVLSNDQRQRVYEMILEKSQNGVPKKGSFKEIASLFKVHPKTIKRIWTRGRQSLAKGASFADVSSRFKGKSPKTDTDLKDRVQNIPLRLRSSIRSLSAALGMPKSTLHDRFKAGELRRHSNSIKPLLTDENKKARLRFCLSMVIENETSPVFEDMLDCVHIDEKWFYLTKETQRYYLAPEESVPVRTCKSKRFIPKIMFLAAVARPRYDHNRKTFFDGKIGIWPFAVQEPAKRTSKNREKGTLETKAINVDKKVYADFLINKVIPAIKAKWPRRDINKPIFIQQDNAKPHIAADHEDFVATATSDGFDIRLRCQPPNSPDLNVLDLGFFNAIQSLKNQLAVRDIDTLIDATVTAFYQIDREKLNRVFLTLQQCMTCIMETDGGNGYRLPHMGKDRLERDGTLPDSLDCDSALIAKVKIALGHQ